MEVEEKIVVMDSGRVLSGLEEHMTQYPDEEAFNPEIE